MSQPSCHTFPETGKTVCGRFLQYWQQNGGLAQQGFPISDEFTEVSDLNGQSYTVQYFERAVFEKHPENAPPFDVLLSQLGTFRFRAKYPNGEPAGAQVPPPPPLADTTAYENALYGYAVTLPGPSWSPPREIIGDESEGELLMSQPPQYIFAYQRLLYVVARSRSELLAMAGAVGTVEGFSSIEVRSATFLGVPAARAEVIMSLTDTPDFRLYWYFFTLGDSTHMVMGGSLASEWESTGRAKTQAMLDSFALTGR
jgi:hypothetical protein